jgi:carbonic anhydrase
VRVLYEILEHNQRFVENKEYEHYQTESKLPAKKLVVVTCMDTRLTELLPKALHLKNGDAKIIKDAGAIVSHPFGSVMRSILVAVYELGAEEICVVGHHGCGMGVIDAEKSLQKMVERGIKQETLSTIQRSGIDLHTWLRGFQSVEESVKQSVKLIKTHPLMLPEIPVHGLVIDPETGKLDLVVDGYQAEAENV